MAKIRRSRRSGASDLSPQEQARVRAAISYLRVRVRGWEQLAKSLGFQSKTLASIVNGTPVSAALTFRVARFAKVRIDELLGGEYPPAGVCPYCGRGGQEDAITMEEQPTTDGEQHD